MNASRWSMRGLVGVMVFFGGCAGGEYYRLGNEAEREGNVQLAYENYCKAAAERPNNSAVVAAIKRVAPTAATYWESEALIAWSQSRHADAWRMAMRCLKIRPDHRGALQFVRKMESEHAEEIASARQEWLAQGGQSLAKAKTVTMEAICGGVIDKLGTATTQPDEPEALALATEEETEAAKIAEDASGESKPVTTSQPVAGRTTAETRTMAQAKQLAAPSQPTAVSTNGVGKEEPSHQVVTKAATPKKPSSANREQGENGAFLAIRTLSKRNKKFERQVLAIDGITIRLRDTDSDPDVDLDLYDGDRRTQKIRDLKMGRSKMFRGHTGRWFRLTVLSIHHKTETVRIGIGPA